MERHINFSDVEAVVKKIYEKYKDFEVEGAVDSRLQGVDPSKFGIVVKLTDGRVIRVGDTDALSPLGAIARVPLFVTNRVQKLDNDNKCHCDKHAIKQPQCCKPKGLPVSAEAVLLTSKIQPKGDADGKYGVIEDMTEAMIGSAPVFDDELYKALTNANAVDNVENKLAEARFELYDDAPVAIDVSTRLTALRATVDQLATMGATLAADGRNPETGEYAFDGSISPKVVAYMAVKGPHHLSKPWLIKSGLPAKSSFGGAIMGVFPGVMSIAAYSPLVNPDGVSVKAYKAIHHIMKHLELSVFDSAQIVID